MQGLHVFDPRAKTEIDLESAVEDDHERFLPISGPLLQSPKPLRCS